MGKISLCVWKEGNKEEQEGQEETRREQHQKEGDLTHIPNEDGRRPEKEREKGNMIWKNI